MEDSWVIPNKAEHIFLSQKFDEMCPHFLSIGMTYEQFWYGDVTMTKDYLKAYKIKAKRENEIEQWNIWKQGMYIYEALCDVSPILHAFSKSGTKPLQYRSKPMMEEIKDVKTEKEKQIEIENERLKARIFFENWAKATAKHFDNQ